MRLKSIFLGLFFAFSQAAFGVTCPTFVAGDVNYISKLNILSGGCTGFGAGGSGDQIQIASAAGSVNAITATYSPAVSLTDKIMAAFVSSGASSSTTPTFAPNGVTARTITARGGAALLVGDIGPAGFVAIVEYNSANTRWELVNPLQPASGGGGGMTNPMTTGGDSIYGGASGAPTRLANGGSGQVLTSGGGTAAPTWATVSGTGSVTTFSCVTANGVSCSVANAATTPAATFTLGAITPTTVNGIGVSKGAGSVLSNTTLGNSALVNNVSSGDVTSVGYQSLIVSTGIRNTALGSSALAQVTSGASNTGIGYTSATGLTTGSSNTHIGSLTTANTGDANAIVIGAGATSLGSNTTAIGNASTTAAKVWGDLSDTKGNVRDLPQNVQSVAYTTVLADCGKHIYHPAADTTARIWTIAANASVAAPIGCMLTFVADTASGVVTIAITTDTMVLSTTGTTGSRTLTGPCMATALKVTSTRWIISGGGCLT